MKLHFGVIFWLPILVSCHVSEIDNNNKYSINHAVLKSDIAACKHNSTITMNKIIECDDNIKTCEAEKAEKLSRLKGVYDTYILSLALQQKSLDFLKNKQSVYGSFCNRVVDSDLAVEPFNGNIYHFHVDASDKKTWSDAQTFCSGIGSVLVVIEHAQENTFLKQRIIALLTTAGISQGDSTFFWTGLNDKDAEDTWEWQASGIPASYTDWKVGFPIEHDNKRCGNMLWKDDKIRWANNDCDEPAFFICEFSDQC